MPKPKTTWKSVERRIASFFGSVRNPLSGGNSGNTRSDSRHDKLFIEAKYRQRHSVITLWRETSILAKKENKTPVVCLAEKGKEGFWVMCHSSDLKTIAQEIKE